MLESSAGQWTSEFPGQRSSPLMVDSTAAKGSPAPSRSNATAAAFLACAESHRVSNLNRLLSAPVKDMAAVDAVVVELDELQAGLRDGQKRPEDPQRF